MTVEGGLLPTAGKVSPRRGMLFRAFIAQNSAIGCAYGGFGVTILPLQERFDAGRGAVSLGLSLVVLMTGLAGPFVAALVQRFGLRAVMTTGGTLCCAGYVTLSMASSMPFVLLAYALLIGPGAGLSGTLPASLLAGGWYPEARGRAIGFATMPVLLVITPIAGMAIIQRYGLPSFYLVLAGVHLLTLPLLMGIRQAPLPPHSAAGRHIDRHATSARTLLTHPLFWAAMLGGGLLNATGIIGSVHMVAVVIERGVAPVHAAMLASLMGAASVLGAIVMGHLSDRLGGAWALALVAAGFASSWALILSTSWLPFTVPAILFIGMAGPGVFPSISLLFAHEFGVATLSRALALSGMFAIPLTFSLPPLAGWVHDLFGDYQPVQMAIIGCCAAVALLFWFIGRKEPSGPLAQVGMEALADSRRN